MEEKATPGDDAVRNVEEEVRRVLEQVKELQDSAASLISWISGEEQPLKQRSVGLQSSIKRIRLSIDSLLHQKILDRRVAEKLDEDLHREICILSDGDAATFLPEKTQGRFLKMFLGPIDVRATRKKIQFKVKEDYNSSKDRTALLFLLFPATLLVLRSWIWNGCMPAFPVQLYQRNTSKLDWWKRVHMALDILSEIPVTSMVL